MNGLVMIHETILHSFSAQVFGTVSETVLSVIPDFVWDSWIRIQDISKELSHFDLQYQILIVLITWFFVNLILIKVTWTIFGEDNIKLLSSND